MLKDHTWHSGMNAHPPSAVGLNIMINLLSLKWNQTVFLLSNNYMNDENLELDQVFLERFLGC